MTYTENYLKHFGIKGMRWGVRRFQNEDGSLTDAGRRKQQKQESRQVKKQQTRELHKLNKTGLKTMFPSHDRLVCF